MTNTHKTKPSNTCTVKLTVKPFGKLTNLVSKLQDIEDRQKRLAIYKKHC